MKNFILPCMPLCGIYIYMFTCAVSSSRECMEDFTDSTKEIIVLENKPWRSLDWDEENDC